MIAALIPPIPMLSTYGNGEFHLLLSHLLDNPEYSAHYKAQAEKGAYLVLDNSAHENGHGDDPAALMFKANQVGAQEVVVPDVLFDADGTIEGALTAHETWFEKRLSPTDLVRQKGFMYVPQGKDYKDWQRCLHELVRIHLFTAKKYDLKQSFVIGLSKDYEVWDGGLLNILYEDLVPLRQELIRENTRMHCHLLGWGRKLWDLGEIARLHKWIRSTDSAKPFVYADAGFNLSKFKAVHTPPPYPKRPKNYFDLKLTGAARDKATKNAMVFRFLAEGGVL